MEPRSNPQAVMERNKRRNAPNSALLSWQFWSTSIPSPWGPQQALASIINNTVTNSSLFGFNSLSYLMVSVLIFLPLLLKSPPKNFFLLSNPCPWVWFYYYVGNKVNEYIESEKVTGGITGDTTKCMVREAWRQSKWSWKVQKLVLTRKAMS